MNAFEPQAVRDRGDVPGMVGHRQMSGRHKVAVTRPTDTDHPELVK